MNLSNFSYVPFVVLSKPLKFAINEQQSKRVTRAEQMIYIKDEVSWVWIIVIKYCMIRILTMNMK